MTAKSNLNSGSHAAEYTRHGLAVCTIPLGSKGPAVKGWNARENAITDPIQASRLTGNVGLLHAWSDTMALDVDNWGTASQWLLSRGVNLAQLFSAPDRVEIVSGRAGRAKLLFRIPTSLGAPVQTLQIKGDDDQMILEFRCADSGGKSVQDVLPPSIHPDTGKPYQWGGPGDWRNLPVIPEVILQIWRDELAERTKGNASAVTLRPPLGLPPQSFAPQNGFDRIEENLWGMTVVESALYHVSSNIRYPRWRNIGWAIMSLGWKSAPQIVHSWSKLTPFRYKPTTTDELIRGFDPSKGITIATLFYEAQKNGWNMPQRYPLAVIPSASPVSPPQIDLIASTSLMTLPYLMPASQAVQEANHFIGFAHDWGGKPTLFREDSEGRVHPCNREEMRLLLANRFVDNGAGGRKPLFQFWEASPGRRTVARVIYDPTGCTTSPNGEPVLNLWRGFARQPQPGDWELMGNHMLAVVCSGNVQHFTYILAWMAHLVQRPWEAPGVVIVLRSQREGTGKTTVLGWLSTLLGIHALVLSEPTQLLGRFNPHLETISFVGLNELGWAGDKDAAAKLKSIITDSTITIERKHGGVYSVPNVLHVMATSNSDWVVPAGDGARRFFVLDVNPARAGDHGYFDALYREAQNGGIEALMDFLYRFDLKTVNLRRVPVTDALREQQERSLPLQAQWALDLADRAGSAGFAGSIIFGGAVHTRALYDDYQSFVNIRRAHPLSSGPFGKWLSKIGLPEGRTSTQRQRVLPSADEFAELVRKSSGVHA
jgi:Bifunctional DNA primase/polymerase, N-terminal/Family of unknown function (DUF5906)/Primase C terminal 2 (PriCT-2)